MKKLMLLTLCLCSISFAKSQVSFLANKPLTIGYFGHYYLHPGLKIGTQFDWRNWSKTKERKEKTITKNKSLFISPQVGFYVHPKNHSGVFLNADFGYQRLKERRGFYHVFSVGLGLMTQINAGTTYVTSSEGVISERKFASRTYILPTLNMELGQEINPKIGWYSKFTAGSKLVYNAGASFETFIELGVKLHLSEFKK